MGKDPSAVVLATALAFCAFCPFFARCDETELNDIKNGIESLSKILVKYPDEFNKRVRFVELHKVIGEIDKVMLGYNGKAKDKLPRIRSLNSAARLKYQNCVDPVFHWCRSINSTFDIFIRIFGDSNVSTFGNIIRMQTVSDLESGLEKTGTFLEFLTYFRDSIGELKNAFEEMSHDVYDDFGPEGFYREEKQNKPYEEQIMLINHFFTDLTQRIKYAALLVNEMESDLQQDKINLQKLQSVIAGANNVRFSPKISYFSIL
ncbi:hypothetical protein KR026_004556 [Drosophila bipectinata]|nr:hypothetical protein KR026_004556 [Drosophila bipectinata]